MKALILAAGLGTRLAPITDQIPKSLVPVNGKPILMKQIENLYENGIKDITVISGYKAEILKCAVYDRWPEIHVIEYSNYASTNNMYSAYLGIRAMFPDGEIDPFLMMNADVFFDASVIKALLADRAENAVVVDVGRYLEESMKVSGKDGRLTSISKGITEKEALGSSIDVYKFGQDGGKVFFEKCVKYIERRGELKLWSEVALNDSFVDVEFCACPLEGRWFEIDDHVDLAAAEVLFAEGW